MRTSITLSAALAALLQTAAAVTGAAEGFAKGVTGGGSATTVYPTTNAELVKYLGDSSARNIVLTKTFDFTGTEGTTSETGCAPYGTGSKCQVAINKNDWCTNYQPNAPKVTVKYDKAPFKPIIVKSNKSLIGQGSKGVIKGKGIRITGGAKNIIVQNIHITGLNPQYVWGGDAITLDGSDLVWIDHVKTSLIGRQHIVLGNAANGRVTISNNEIDGQTSWSATCDNHHYWGLYLTGANDLVTLKGNYIHHTSGRAPKVGANTLLHAVNNYFYDNTGHAFEGDSTAMIVAEGNVFQNVKAALDSSFAGKFFASPDTNTNKACAAALGHNCQLSAYGSSGSLKGTNTAILAKFSGKNVASAGLATTANNAVTKAGFGKI
ncbi:Pectin lyase like protein [Verticillium longisporum]|nr:Pectin lyase like protein [Verticillium longisporum]